MTREEAIEAIKEAYGNSEYTDEIIKALEQDPCADTVSRQAVIDAIKNYASMLWEKYYEQFPESTILEMIQELPSVTPQPKVGRWKRIKKEKYVQHAMSYYRCSECGKEMIGTHNYCPNCGCKMQEGNAE